MWAIEDSPAQRRLTEGGGIILPPAITTSTHNRLPPASLRSYDLMALYKYACYYYYYLKNNIIRTLNISDRLVIVPEPFCYC